MLKTTLLVTAATLGANAALADSIDTAPGLPLWEAKTIQRLHATEEQQRPSPHRDGQFAVTHKRAAFNAVGPDVALTGHTHPAHHDDNLTAREHKWGYKLSPKTAS